MVSFFCASHFTFRKMLCLVAFWLFSSINLTGQTTQNVAVPWISQMIDGCGVWTLCGHTSFEMVRAYTEGRTTASQDNIAQYIRDLGQVSCGSGTPNPNDLVGLATLYGHNAKWFGMSSLGLSNNSGELGLADLKNLLNQGIPIIVQVHTAMNTSNGTHWMVLRQIDDQPGSNNDYVYVNDPGTSYATTGTNRKFTLQQFLDSWERTGRNQPYKRCVVVYPLTKLNQSLSIYAGSVATPKKLDLYIDNKSFNANFTSSMLQNIKITDGSTVYSIPKARLTDNYQRLVGTTNWQHLQITLQAADISGMANAHGYRSISFELNDGGTIRKYQNDKIYFANYDFTQNSFTDVADLQNWAKLYIYKGARLGLFRGNSLETFNPAGLLTRGQAATVLINAAVRLEHCNINTSTDGGTFADVPVGSTYFDVVQTMRNYGFCNTTNTNFNPNDNMTVGQFCYFLTKVFNIKASDYASTQYLNVKNQLITPIHPNADLQNAMAAILKLVDIREETAGFWTTESVWEFHDYSKNIVPITSAITINGEEFIPRSVMAKVLTNIVLYRSKTNRIPLNIVGANTPESVIAPTIDDMVAIGEKYDNLSTPITTSAPNPPTQQAYSVVSGGTLNITYPSDYDRNGNPQHFYWSMEKKGALLTSTANTHKSVRFTAPSVSSTTQWKLYTYIANNKGKSNETYITITVDPTNGGGTGGSTTPTVNANSLNLYGETTNSIAATWTRGNGQFCLVTCTELSGNPPDQPEYRIYSGNSNFANAPSVFSLSDSKVVYTGTGNNVTVTGLSPNTSYRFVVYEYNGSTDATVRYGFSGALPEQRATTLRANIVTTTSDFTYPNTIVAGQTSTFTNSSSNYTSSTWSVNNGATLNPVNGGTTCSIYFPTAGTYNVTLVANNSATGQSVSTTKSVSVVTLASTLPDLSPQNLSLSASTMIAGQSITATCYVNNSSSLAGSQSSNITFRLSTDQIYDDTDYGLGQETYTVNAGQSVFVTHNMAIPNTQTAGQYYIVAKADDWFGAPNGLIGESNESNNTIVTPLFIQTALPDLLVQNITVATNTVGSGQNFSCTGTFRNIGLGDVRNFTAASVYFSTDNQFSPNTDIRLRGTFYPDGLYANTTVSKTLSLQTAANMPNGSYYLFVVVDYQGTSEDYNRESNENNNVTMLSSQIIISNPNQPTIQAKDLQITNITANSMRVSWTRGNGSACILIASGQNNAPSMTKDEVSYIPNSNFSLATGIYNPNNSGINPSTKVVYDGIGSFVDITGLNTDETYAFYVLEYNGTGNSKDYFQVIPYAIAAHTTSNVIDGWKRLSGYNNSSSFDYDVRFFDSNNGFLLKKSNPQIALTKDGGVTWKIKPITLDNDLSYGVGILDLSIAGSHWIGNSGWLVDEVGGTVYKTNDAGNNWLKTNNTYNRRARDIFFKNVNEGYLACGHIENSNNYDGGAILKTIDGGNTWTLLKAFSKIVISVFFLDAQNGWATSIDGNGGIILRTTDGGTTWLSTAINPQNIGGAWGITKIHFLSQQIGFAAGAFGHLLKTTNGGISWSVIHQTPTLTGTGDSEVKFEFLSNGIGFIKWANNFLSKTTDGGNTWVTGAKIQNLGNNGFIGGLSVLDANNIFVCGQGGLYKTTTGGQNQGIKLNSLNQQTICSGNTLKLPLKVIGTFDATNNFTVQLSNASGSFATPTTLTTFTNVGNDSIECALPNSLAQGSSYRIRVLSSNPVLISDTTALLTINATPSVSVVVNATNGTQICVGTNATFQATPTNGGTTPQYQWKLNGSNVGTNAATFSSTALQNSDAVWVELRSNAACASATPTPSAPLSINVTTVPTPFIQAIDNTLASSSSIGNQWFLNGQAITGATSQFYALTGSSQNGTYTVRVTQNSCSAISQPFVFTYIAPSIKTQTLTQTSYCVGATLKLPYYLNGSFNANATYTVQLSNATGSFATPTTIFTSTTLPYDTINCLLPTSLATGNAYRIRITANNPTATSDTTVALTITSTPSVSVSISALNGTSICTGTTVQFTATPTNSGNTPLYQWKLNSNNVGLNQATYSNANLRDGDIVKAEMVSNALCAATTPVTSLALSMQVTTLPIPTILASGNVLASSALTGNQWFFNGQVITGATNQFYTATQTGFYTVRVTINNCTIISVVFNHTVTATNDLDKDQSIVKVYPNPTTGQFTIELQNNTSIKSEVTVSNTLGQIILRQDLINNIGQFDISSMTSGIYLIKIRTEKREIRRKIMVNR